MPNSLTMIFMVETLSHMYQLDHQCLEIEDTYVGGKP